LPPPHLHATPPRFSGSGPTFRRVVFPRGPLGRISESLSVCFVYVKFFLSARVVGLRCCFFVLPAFCPASLLFARYFPGLHICLECSVPFVSGFFFCKLLNPASPQSSVSGFILLVILPVLFLNDDWRGRFSPEPPEFDRSFNDHPPLLRWAPEPRFMLLPSCHNCCLGGFFFFPGFVRFSLSVPWCFFCYRYPLGRAFLFFDDFLVGSGPCPSTTSSESLFDSVVFSFRFGLFRSRGLVDEIRICCPLVSSFSEPTIPRTLVQLIPFQMSLAFGTRN